MKDLERSNVEMTNFIIITVTTLITCAVAIVCTDKAEQQGHDDNDGLFYYIGTCGIGLVYTTVDVIFMVNGAL